MDIWKWMFMICFTFSCEQEQSVWTEKGGLHLAEGPENWLFPTADSVTSSQIGFGDARRWKVLLAFQAANEALMCFERDLFTKSVVAGEMSCPTKSDVRPMKALFSFVSGICRTRTARNSTARCKCSRYFYMTPPPHPPIITICTAAHPPPPHFTACNCSWTCPCFLFYLTLTYYC